MCTRCENLNFLSGKSEIVRGFEIEFVCKITRTSFEMSWFSKVTRWFVEFIFTSERPFFFFFGLKKFIKDDDDDRVISGAPYREQTNSNRQKKKKQKVIQQHNTPWIPSIVRRYTHTHQDNNNNISGNSNSVCVCVCVDVNELYYHRAARSRTKLRQNKESEWRIYRL